MSVSYLQTDRGPDTLADRYPVVVAASSPAARARAEMTLANAGYRTSLGDGIRRGRASAPAQVSRVPVSSLCIVAEVPPTTALRWIKSLTDRGLFVRRHDPRDVRGVFIELSRETSDAMDHYFGEVSPQLAV